MSPEKEELLRLLPKSPVNKFLYPKSRQFPVDEICEQIVRELEKRNWQVPGIKVKFYDYGSGEQKLRMLSTIQGEEFKLYFGRTQRGLTGGKWNDLAAVTEIVIPRKEINIFEDESGPTFYLYVGENWKKDGQQFINGTKVNSKLNGEPRTYLKYTGGCDCQMTEGASFEATGLITAMIDGDSKRLSMMSHTHRGWRSPLLVHDNDLGREYSPKGKEPRFFRTEDILEEFKKYLSEVVFQRILSSPILKDAVDILTPAPAIPFPWSLIKGNMFTFGEWEDEERIKKGEKDTKQLEPAERYGMTGSGYRLISLDTPNDGSVPEIAYEGFLWCGITPSNIMGPIASLDIPGHYRWDREQFVVKIKPKKANDIYIADHALYEKRRKEICAAVEKGRDRLTDAEVADFNQARARSIIPISKYGGGFKNPVILVNRELDLDEVEVVSGPHKKKSF